MAIYKDAVEGENVTVKIHVGGDEPSRAYLYVDVAEGARQTLTRDECVRVAHSLLTAALAMPPKEEGE